MIANNTTAQAYDRLQQSIDWYTADDASQLNIMYIMKQLLIQAKSYEPIFIETLNGFERTTSTVNDRYDAITRRIQSFENKTN